MTPCNQIECGGSIAGDGYCDTCGMAAGTPAGQPEHVGVNPLVGAPSVTIAAPEAPGVSGRSNSSGRRDPLSQRTSASGAPSSATRRGVGAGLISVDPTPAGDPQAALMSQAQVAAVLGAVAEQERYCHACGRPVGRASGSGPGRVQGFCGGCRTEFNFVTNAPTLKAGVVVAGQYEILGPLAHGGLGWIYLGRDQAVSGRWVVLKGLLNQSDPDAAAAAVAERRFLAEIDHGNIVNIYNFVTHQGAGYIVMEMVGGESLNEKLKRRRRANDGMYDPMPVIEAVAYVMAILPAFAYLHDHGMVYNDLKPANIMAVGNDVKLIDVGAVMKIADTHAAIFGTPGFQAPEVAQLGPSIASDIYTIGRTLAVLTLNFVFHDGPYQYSLPERDTQEVLIKWESYHRFLLKAAAYHPDDRFQSVDEMSVQLAGVFRELVSITEQRPTGAGSSLFGPDNISSLLAKSAGTFSATEIDWRVLPTPRIDESDPAATFIDSLPADDPEQAVHLIDAAIEALRVRPEAELMTHLAWQLIRLGRNPEPALAMVERNNPWDWRVQWYRGLAALVSGSSIDAAEAFSRVWTELPGELAPQLGVALAAELAGETQRAADIYDRILTVDPSFASAAFGLARCGMSRGDKEAAVGAYGRVPDSSVAHHEAQVAIARTLLNPEVGVAPVSADELTRAATTIDRLNLDAAMRASLSAEVYQRAIDGLEQGIIGANSISVLGRDMNPGELRRGLEESYRVRARLAVDQAERYRLVDMANQVRARTLL